MVLEISLHSSRGNITINSCTRTRIGHDSEKDQSSWIDVSCIGRRRFHCRPSKSNDWLIGRSVISSKTDDGQSSRTNRCFARQRSLLSFALYTYVCTYTWQTRSETKTSDDLPLSFLLSRSLTAAWIKYGCEAEGCIRVPIAAHLTAPCSLSICCHCLDRKSVV